MLRKIVIAFCLGLTCMTAALAQSRPPVVQPTLPVLGMPPPAAAARPPAAVAPQQAPVPMASSAEALNQEYRLGVADQLRIDVREEPDLTLDAQVQPDGTIRYPFLGSIVARGKTAAQLQWEITTALRNGYLVRPDVRVHVLTYRPFFITGQVVKPGGYPFVLGLTVEKAATLAGGFTDRASMRNIFVIREGQMQAQKQKVTLDAVIFPGDTVVIEESLF